MLYVDSDKDLLSDLEEAILGTSRWLKDSDGDGINDRLELAYGTDPCTRIRISGAMEMGNGSAK